MKVNILGEWVDSLQASGRYTAARFSPLFHIESVKTPVLLIQGDADPR